MLEVILESAVRATAIAGGVGAALWALRIRDAAVRHAVWAAVAVGMLLLPIAIAWGPEAPVRVMTPKLSPAPIVVLDAPPSVATPEAPLYRGVDAKRTAIRSFDWRAWGIGIYAVGLLAMLARLAVGGWRVRRLMREAVLREGVLTHPACSAPVTVGWWRSSVILPVEWTSWPQEQREIVLAHEGEHVRRRDALVHWLALVNRAVFWFHPLAWWLEWHIGELAEQRCDEAVLAQGHDAREYSAYLVEMARGIQARGARIQWVGMAMAGFGLTQRVRAILAGAPMQRIGRARAVAIALICAGIVGTLAMGQLAEAQPKLGFEVASIKQANPNAAGSTINRAGNGVRISNLSLLEMIRFAYADFGQNLEIAGGPDWLGRRRFDVEAKAGIENPTPDQSRQMLQNLLAERFGVRVHWDSKDAPIFALVLSRKDGKLGPGAKPFAEASCPKEDPKDPDVPGPCEVSINRNGSANSLTIQGGTMEHLANALGMGQFGLDRKTVDKTGLAGRFDMQLDYEASLRVADPTTETGPSLFTALEEQLGVKLESARGQVEFLVVDAAEMPTEN